MRDPEREAREHAMWLAAEEAWDREVDRLVERIERLMAIELVALVYAERLRASERSLTVLDAARHQVRHASAELARVGAVLDDALRLGGAPCSMG